jgi:cytochrome c oxidase subunit III
VTATTAKIRPLLTPRRTGYHDSGGEERERPFISSGMLAVLMLIASEMMLFSGLIGSFLIFRLSAPFWPPPTLPRLPLNVTWANTLVLLFSAVTMYLAVRAVHRSRQRLLRRWLIVTAVLGTTFLTVQGSEWVRLVAHGLTLKSGSYGGTFYLLIGCHGLHVTAAVIWLASVTWVAMRGRYNAHNSGGVERIAAFWFFVCAIWPVLFELVYRM